MQDIRQTLAASPFWTSPARVTLWNVVCNATSAFIKDGALTLSAALSFYTLLSFAPLLILGLWLVAVDPIGIISMQTMLNQLGALAGRGVQDVAEIIIQGAQERPSIGNLAGVVSVAITLVGVTTVFAQLQTSLNQIWHIEAKPGNAIWSWLRRRILSIGIVFSLVFLLIVSLIVNSILSLVLTNTGTVWMVVNQLVSVGVFSVLFGLLFRYVPDVRLQWHIAFWGGFATALLFAIGQAFISYYIRQANVGGAYGAASSLVVLLVWVYYSAAVFFLGAELVQAWVHEAGEKISTCAHAKKVKT